MDVPDLPHYPGFGFRLELGAENLAFLRRLYSAGRITEYLRLIHPQLSCPRDMPSRGLGEEPTARHANSRWRNWRDDHLAGLARLFPASAAVGEAQREIDLVLRWRERAPPQYRSWRHD